MKKIIIPISIVGILVLSGLGAVAVTESEKEEFISETIFFSQPMVNEKTDYVSIEITEATSASWETDKPKLPMVTKVYTFPFGTHVDNVEISFSDVIEQKISKPIEPAPESQIVSIYASNKIEKQETLTYSDIDVYPDHRFSYKMGAGLKDEEHVIYLAVHFCPILYIPNENTIYYSTSATVDVTYTLPENPFIFLDEYDLLIIAPAEFESALQPLVDHKNSLDPPVDTILVTLDEIPSVGVDEQESIKYYIKDAIESWGITYVLLVGAGVEDEELFPVRNVWLPSPPYEEYFPSDLYYADVYNATGGFSDWDYDGDEKYAEYPTDMPNVDVCPDVYLGKLPCNDVSEVNTMVDKIINYKAHNKMTNKILQVGGDTFPGSSQYEGEYANEKVLEKLPGYSTTRLWGTNGELTKSNIGKGFRSNVDFADFSGHGSWAGWSTHPPDDAETWIPPETTISPYNSFSYVDVDLYRLTNAKKLPVIMLNACSNNKYTEDPNCLGWKMLSKKNGGGIATFAASGIGYGVPGDETARRFGWMEVKTFEELYNNKILGQVWGNCITDYYNTFEFYLGDIDWRTMIEFSMFGDPTLVIEDGDDPESVSMDIPLFLRFLQQHPHMFPILRQLLGL